MAPRAMELTELVRPRFPVPRLILCLFCTGDTGWLCGLMLLTKFGGVVPVRPIGVGA